MKRNVFLSLISVYSKAILIIFALQSCESMVEVDLPDNQVNHEEVYKDIATTKAALSYIYSRIKETPMLSKGANGLSYNLSLYTDELDYYGNNTNDFYINAVEANNSIVEFWWNNSYQDLYAINAFIEGLSKSEAIDSDNKKQLLGEAYALRALYYHYLTILYGDIPYTTTTDYNFNTSIGKTSYNEVLKQIEKDLLQAIEYLDYPNRSSEKFYINRAVAELLITENYLLQKRFKSAETHIKNLIQSNLYKIETDLSQTFKKTAKSTIWQISPALQSEITKEAGQYIFTALTGNTVTLSEHLIQSFDEYDLRKQNWIQKVTINEQDYYGAYKYKNKTDNTDEYSIFFRIEQAYFLWAESLIGQDKTSEAVKVINELKEARGLPVISTALSKNEIIEELIAESYKEFFTENGYRFLTLKRNENLNALNNSKLNWTTHHQLLPIPEKQLLINKNLLPNNEGY